MIPFKNVIISSDLISKEFVCNITKCKGKCCVAGDAGAPLEKDEVLKPKSPPKPKVKAAAQP